MARFLLRGSILRKIMLVLPVSWPVPACRLLLPWHNTEVAEATAEAAGISEVADTLPAGGTHVNAPHGSAPAGHGAGVRIRGPAAALLGKINAGSFRFRPNPNSPSPNSPTPVPHFRLSSIL